MNAPQAIPVIWLLSADIMGPLGGGFRQQRWCEYILARGQSVRLFQISGLFDVRWIDVHSVEELREKRAAWVSAARPRAGVRDTKGARIGRFIKHVFMIDLLFPSLFRLVMTMRTMLREASRPITLLCSSPPFAMAVAGRVMKMLYGDRLVMALDMRDLWSLHTAFPGPKFQKRIIEKWVIGGADIFTTVAPALASRFKTQFGADATVVYNVATQAAAPEKPVSDFSWGTLSPALYDKSTKIVYTGSIPAGFYDLNGFLDAVERYAANHDARALQFVFVGAGGEVAARLQGRAIPRDMIVFVSQMSHAAIGEIQQAADVLLFMGYKADDNQGQVSIKLFEYFRQEKPILPVHIRTGSDVDWLLRFYCGSSVELLSENAIAYILVSIGCGDLSSLPKASGVKEKDKILLSAYDEITEVIMDRYRHSG